MFKKKILCCLISVLILLSACNQNQTAELVIPPTYAEEIYLDLVLGAQATGTGCNVTFEKQVYRDEGSQKIIYAVKVKEEGNCEKTSTNRNLILVPRIPPEYSVEFLIQATGND